MGKFKIKAFCKINLFLRVIKRLNNGYHDISSLITFCNLFDEISVKKFNGKKDDITFSGKFKKGINRKSNTITKVLFNLRDKNFFQNQSFKINVKKNLPHGAGLGSASSNAAALLNFFNLKMKLKLKKKEVEKIALKIGADVPIILEKKNTLLTGKKNKFFRFNKKLKLNILIVYPNIICSTRNMYRKNRVFTKSISRFNFNSKNRNKLINFLKQEKNDLEKTVIKFNSTIGKIIRIIKKQEGCYFSRITGSGSACIGVFSNTKKAILTQKLIKLKFPKYWCVVSKTI